MLINLTWDTTTPNEHYRVFSRLRDNLMMDYHMNEERAIDFQEFILTTDAGKVILTEWAKQKHGITLTVFALGGEEDNIHWTAFSYGVDILEDEYLTKFILAGAQ